MKTLLLFIALSAYSNPAGYENPEEVESDDPMPVEAPISVGLTGFVSIGIGYGLIKFKERRTPIN